MTMEDEETLRHVRTTLTKLNDRLSEKYTDEVVLNIREFRKYIPLFKQENSGKETYLTDEYLRITNNGYSTVIVVDDFKDVLFKLPPILTRLNYKPNKEVMKAIHSKNSLPKGNIKTEKEIEGLYETLINDAEHQRQMQNIREKQNEYENIIKTYFGKKYEDIESNRGVVILDDDD